jgi:hypothetical protein
MKKDLLKNTNPLWCGFPRNKEDITRIVIHGTGGGGTLPFMKQGGQGKQDKKIGLFHYLIEKNGDIIQLVEDLEWVYHSSAGKMDKNSIGIEILKTKADNSDIPTKEQYTAILELIKSLVEKYNIDCFMSHDYSRKKYSNKSPKPCPNTFDWGLLKGFNKLMFVSQRC